ncbi:MAG: hypothetical protein WBJ84_09300 [Bacteroidales bacterium]
MSLSGKSYFSKNIVRITIGIILIVIALTNYKHSYYNNPERVIEWDVKSYYAYLPVFFIYHDPMLKFRDEDPEKFGNLIWPIYLETGKPTMIYSIGMSVLYSPFFFAAHAVALLTDYEADGYSTPYRFALTFSAFFYLWIGLIFLTRILRKYFKDQIISIVLLVLVFGTNMYYYSTYEAPMTHIGNFAMITAFIWLTIRFYEKPTLKAIILPGLLAGLITLVRPSNIIVLVLFFLWDIKSFNDFKNRILFFLKRFHWVALMAFLFVLVWVPQFVYWHWVSGKIFFNAYTLRNETFSFDNPQIFNILFSYRKGWLIYTPLMILSIAGIFLLPRRIPGLLLSLVLFSVLNIYILSSWWSWWYGGSFGLRSFIDSYGLMAIPLACLTEFALQKKKFFKYAYLTLITLILSLNQFQTWQYKSGLIHFDAMNKATYWGIFFRTHGTERYWNILEESKAEYLRIDTENAEKTRIKRKAKSKAKS